MATILITDDSSYVINSLENILVKAGHTVVAKASDGYEAVELYTKFEPDIVTMDITMPGIDGIMALEKIVKSYPDAKVIMISARGKESIVFEALEKGAKNYIFKPFIPDYVVKIVNKVLNGEA